VTLKRTLFLAVFLDQLDLGIDWLVATITVVLAIGWLRTYWNQRMLLRNESKRLEPPVSCP
jgi:hypothetical protein